MSFKDKKLGTIFPTRTGTPTGAGNERTMLQKLNDATGFRTGINLRPDGSYTLCRTKGGQPQFTNVDAVNVAAPVDPRPYMESGQLEWAFPSDTSPAKFDPARWHFLDLPTSSTYLGYVTGNTGAQDNFPALTESMESQAVGYPKVKLTANSTVQEIAQAAVTDAANKLTYGPMTVRKKMVAGLFPPSLFSGKMRLFMQAQYGAKESLTWPLKLEVVGETTLLKYAVGSNTIQFGFGGGNTPGVFTASDGTFWLIVVSHAGTTFTATAYAINHTAEVAALVTRYKAGGLQEAEKTRLEAYIFAHSVIDVANPRLVGSFVGPAGSPMAYGWKWNKDGSKASIVLHQPTGTGYSDTVWVSSTVHISFSYTGGALAMSSQTVSDGAWTDGWGTYNIFTPSSETEAAPLVLFSLATHRAGVMPAFAFANVAVYGYYKDDVWTATKISRTIPTGTYPKYSQSDSGILFGADAAVGSPNRHERGVLHSETSCAYESHNLSQDYTMDLSVGAMTFNGKSENGTHFYYTRKLEGGIFSSGDRHAIDFTTDGAQTISYSNDLVTPRGTPATGLLGPAAQRFMWLGRVRRDTWSHTGWKHRAWVLVVPAGDCEAVYAATYESEISDLVTHNWYNEEGLMGFHGTASGGPYDTRTWTQASQTGGFYGVGNDPTSGSDNAKPPKPDVSVYCFNAVVLGAAGTPGGSYETLFTVDYRYPYYARGMQTYTSYGGCYLMSEGLKLPNSVELRPFVGWA